MYQQHQLQQEYQQQNEMMQHHQPHHQRQDLMQMTGTENMLTFHNNDGNNHQHFQEVIP